MCHCDGDADFWECAGARDNKMLSLGRKGLRRDIWSDVIPDRAPVTDVFTDVMEALTILLSF